MSDFEDKLAEIHKNVEKMRKHAIEGDDGRAAGLEDYIRMVALDAVASGAFRARCNRGPCR